ncbi:hypothetical protein C0J52_10515 [Blattella germanica]|nr:hypothetical protein C0J52_10515 [Blattella germanica]
MDCRNAATEYADAILMETHSWQLLKFVEDVQTQPAKYVDSSERKILRRIFIPVNDVCVWQIRTNKELYTKPPVPARPVIGPKPDINLPKPPLPPDHSFQGHVLNIFDEDVYESLDAGATDNLHKEVAALMRAPAQQDTYEPYELIKEEVSINRVSFPRH